MISNWTRLHLHLNRYILSSALVFISTILFLSVSVEGAAAAGAGQYKYKTIDLYMKKSENNTYFYGSGQVQRKMTVSSDEYFKGSPYVCTPSGFGRTSHCYSRH